MASTRMWQTLMVFSVFCVCAHAKNVPKPIKLSEENWRDMLKGEWFVSFYAPWCPACKSLKPVWDQVATWTEDLEFNVGMVDVTENPGLSGRFLVMSLPTIYHVNDGEFRTYRGPREEKALISYVDDNKWREVEPIPWYKSPGATHMGALGLFFKASMAIRDLHTSMTEEYGIPVWGSYTIFAIVTIILGLFIGLVIVFFCDYMFPPLPLSTKYRAVQRDTGDLLDESKDNDSDMIVDDRPQDPHQDFQDEDASSGRTEQNEDTSNARHRRPASDQKD